VKKVLTVLELQQPVEIKTLVPSSEELATEKLLSPKGREKKDRKLK
jgi:hypothetical protein